MNDSFLEENYPDLNKRHICIAKNVELLCKTRGKIHPVCCKRRSINMFALYVIYLFTYFFE